MSAVSEYVAVGYFRDVRRSGNGENYKVYKALVVAHQPYKSIQTRLVLDSSVTKITVTRNKVSQVVELNNLTNVTINGANGINLTYNRGSLNLQIPAGAALLIKF